MRRLTLLLLLSSLAVLAGCYAMFTFSPVAPLQRQPADLSPEAKLTYARDALASADPAAMRAAYEAISGEDSAEAQYLAACLATELSGFPHFVAGLIDGTLFVTSGSMSEIEDYIDSHAVDADYLIAAADHLEAAQGSGAAVQPMDCVTAACGAILAAARQPDGSLDFSNPSSLDLSGAVGFIDDALLLMGTRPAEDPELLFVQTFQDYLESF